MSETDINNKAAFYSINRKTGFTLLELIIVLAVISILVAMATNIYGLYRKKAITVEARMGLNSIHKLEVGYYADQETYTADLDQLGFKMAGRSRYSYEISSADSTGYVGRATANLDSDPDIDIWTVDNTGRIIQVSVD